MAIWSFGMYCLLTKRVSFAGSSRNKPDAMPTHHFTKEQLLDMFGDLHDICRAVHIWQRDDIVRGKGKAIHQSSKQFD